MVPCKVGSAWEILAPAKLNLYLEVLGRRPDGFHELETLMVPVRIYDHLRWSDAPTNSQRCELRVRQAISVGEGDREKLPLGDSSSDNLVLRAAELLARNAGVASRGVFELVKRIPIQAGMGGGSADAAAALLLANAAWGINYPRSQLIKLAAELGSDVPFFVHSVPAICRGRGEQVEAVGRMPRLHFVVVKPPVGLPTGAVFSKLESATSRSPIASGEQVAQLVESLQRGALSGAGKWMTNRLEAAAGQISPWIGRLRETFGAEGLVGHAMTGSGSAYFAIARSTHHAKSLARKFAGMNLGNALATSSG